MNLAINDPTMPGPGELSSSDRERRQSISTAHRAGSPTTSSMAGSPVLTMRGDPHHNRTPSLGELHQELEQEQEAQVNRLLMCIRQQQAQLEQLQQQQTGHATGSAIDDSTPSSELSISIPNFPPLPQQARRSSVHLRRGSSQMSPVVGSQTEPVSNNSTSDFGSFGGDGIPRRNSRDDSVFYQAETASLRRENQMLKLRVRELEHQISELTTSPRHAPPTSSQLASSSSADETPSGSEPEPRSRIPGAETEKS